MKILCPFSQLVTSPPRRSLGKYLSRHKYAICHALLEEIFDLMGGGEETDGADENVGVLTLQLSGKRELIAWSDGLVEMK